MSKASVLIATLALIACVAKQLPHHALLGKWKSNAELTLASMNNVKGVTPEARALFEDDFFGHLIIEWKEHESRAVNEKDKYDSGYESYQVLETINEHITLKEWNDILQRYDEYTLYLEGDCYYVITSKFEFREYFCRY